MATGRPICVAVRRSDESHWRRRVPSKRIVVLDNQLTRTFFGTNQLDEGVHAVACHPCGNDQDRPEALRKPGLRDRQRRLARSRRSVRRMGPPHLSRCAPTAARSTSCKASPRSRPPGRSSKRFKGPNSYIWDMRIATSSIPREQLSRILYKVIDPKNSGSAAARRAALSAGGAVSRRPAELEQLIKDFPDLAHFKEQVKALHQLSALRLLEGNRAAARRRGSSGWRRRHARAVSRPTAWPAKRCSRFARCSTRSRASRTQTEKIAALLKQHIAELQGRRRRARTSTPIVAEITAI